jgi:hypothetical protein
MIIQNIKEARMIAGLFIKNNYKVIMLSDYLNSYIFTETNS